MSFTLRPNLIDAKLNYKQIADEFCKYYYSKYDTNFDSLTSLYYPDSQFTYQDEEVSGFINLLNKIKSNGVYKFTHHNMKVNTQPIGSKHILINVYGTLSLNDSIYQNKFNETILLQRSEDNNNFSICSTIFRLLD